MRIPTSRGFWLFLVVLTQWMGLASAKSQEIQMTVGEQRSMTYENITTISVGNPEVANVKQVSTNTFLLYALEQGRTSIVIFRRGAKSVNLSVGVSKEDVGNLISEVKRLLGNPDGVTIRPVGNRVISDGKANSASDFKRMQAVLAMYPQVTSFVEMNNEAQEVVAKQYDSALKKAGLSGVEATVVGTRIFLEGSVESDLESKKVQSVIQAIGGDIENLVSIGLKRMVMVDVEFIEIKESGTDHFGIKWPLSWDGESAMTFDLLKAITPEGPMRTSLSGNIQLNTSAALGFLMQDGYARILAKPRLVTSSGSKAKFLAGGEVPIVVVSAMSVSVTYKEFGVKLEVTPQADRLGNIQLQLMAEVSDLDPSISVTIGDIYVPGFTVDKAETNVTLRHGETIMLSNLFHHNEGKDVSKVPLLGHIPILGEFFKSRTFKDKKAQIAVLVTPSVVNPETPKIQNMIKDVREVYRDAKDQVNYSIFD